MLELESFLSLGEKSTLQGDFSPLQRCQNLSNLIIQIFKAKNIDILRDLIIGIGEENKVKEIIIDLDSRLINDNWTGS